MVRAKTSKPSVAKKVHDFFDKITDKKTLLCPNVLSRILSFSDSRSQCNLGLTCKTTQKYFQKNFVSPQELYYCKKDKDAPYNAWCTTKETMCKGFVLKYSGDDTWEQSGHYAVQKVTNAGVHLRRLTNLHKATVGKRKFFIPYVYADSEWECRKEFTNHHEHFWESFEDNWEIIAKSREEYLPMFEEHFAHVMPAWKIKSRGYPKLMM